MRCEAQSNPPAGSAPRQIKVHGTPHGTPQEDRLNPLGILLGISAAVFWGAYLAMSRAGVGMGLDGYDVAFIRFAVGGVLMLPWFLMNSPHTLGGVGWGRGIALALTAGPLFILLTVAGYFFAPLAHGAVIQPSTSMVATAAMAVFLFGERVGPARTLGLAVVVIGLVVVSGQGLFHASLETPIGDAMFAAAGLLWAIFTVLGKRWGISPVAATAAVSVLSCAVMVPGYLATVGLSKLAAVPWEILLTQIVVQGALAGVVAMLCYTRAVQLLGAGRAAIFPALVPVSAIVVGIPVAGEFPTASQFAGLAVVTTGMLIALGVLRLPRLRQ
ncbi:DMT family transporter [Hwanghaeella sp.]|uniref:DMT family transporter n=1 Tax=Hwanghaeella sp. TaxID=2605943 RepID=UPI003CCB9ED4